MTFKRLDCRIGLSTLVFAFFLYGCASRGPVQKQQSVENKESSKQKNKLSQKSEESVSAPSWYTNREIQSSNELVKIGYGRGDSRNEAMNQALGHVAKKLGLRIKSIQQRSIEENEQSIEDEFQQQTKISAEHRVKNFDNLRTESKGGLYFSAYRVDRRPLSSIIASRLNDKLPEKTFPLSNLEWNGPEPLIEGDVIQSIEEKLIDPQDGTGNHSLSVSLKRANDKWILSLGPVDQTLENTDFARLLDWSDGEKESLSVELMPQKKSRKHNRLKQGDQFFFRIKSDNPGGYYALFNLYSDGRISVLKGASKLNEVQFVPSRESLDNGEIFQANLLQAGRPTLDVYLAVSSSQQFSTTDFRYLGKGKQMVQGKRSYQIHNLLEWLDENPFKDVEAITVQILPDESF